MQRLVSQVNNLGRRSVLAKHSRAIEPEYIMRMVAKKRSSSMEAYQVFRSKAKGVAMATLLCQELTNISLAGLSELFKIIANSGYQ